MSDIQSSCKKAIKIYVGYEGENIPQNWNSCLVGPNIVFDVQALASYFFKDSSEISYDAFMLAAAVEYCDAYKKRPDMTWSCEFILSVPVSAPDIWNDPEVNKLLATSLNVLTGDSWSVSFRKREAEVVWPKHKILNLPSNSEAVIAFSDGMDSLAVTGLSRLKYGKNLTQLRLGPKKSPKRSAPFIAVPFTTILPKPIRKNAERSGRSRGFKFAILSIIASFLSETSQIIVPESGQGALGPALVTVGRVPIDYRNHPFFFQIMEKLTAKLFGINVVFSIPRIWNTKAETLRQYIDETGEVDKWQNTVSCWRDSRFTLEQKQCGICAACLLRRMSVHAAGLTEASDQYLWHDLKVENFENGSIKPYENLGSQNSYLKYGRAAVCHLNDLAFMNDLNNKSINAGKIARAYGMDKQKVMIKQILLLEKHRGEWEGFLASLGGKSFISKWAKGGIQNAA